MKNQNKRKYIQSPVILEPKCVVSTYNMFNRVNTQTGRYTQNTVKSYPRKHSHQSPRHVSECQNSPFERFLSPFRTKKTNEITKEEKNKANRSRKLEKNVFKNIVESCKQKDSRTEMQTIYPYIPSKFQKNMSKTEPDSNVKLTKRSISTTFSNKDSHGKHIQEQRNKNIEPLKTSKHIHKYATKSDSYIDKTPTKSRNLKSLVINLSNFMFSNSKNKKLLSNINTKKYHGQFNTPIGHQTDINIIKHSKSDQPSNLFFMDAFKTSKSVRNTNVSTRGNIGRENDAKQYNSSQYRDAAVRQTYTKSESASNFKKLNRPNKKDFLKNRHNNNKYFYNQFNKSTKKLKISENDHKYGTKSESNIHKLDNKNNVLKSFMSSLSNLMFSYPKNKKSLPKLSTSTQNYRRWFNKHQKDVHIIKNSKSEQPSNLKDDSKIPKRLRNTNVSTGTKVAYQNNKEKYKIAHNQYEDTAVRHLHPTNKHKQKYMTGLKTTDSQLQFIDFSRKKNVPYMHHHVVQIAANKSSVNRGAKSRKTYKKEKQINTNYGVRNKGIQIQIHTNPSKNVKMTNTVSNDKKAIDFLKSICHKKKRGKSKGCFFKSQNIDKICTTKENKGRNKGCIAKYSSDYRRYREDKLGKSICKRSEKYCKPVPYEDMKCISTCKKNICGWRREKNNLKTTNVGNNISHKLRNISSGDATADKNQTISNTGKRNTGDIGTLKMSKWFKSNDVHKENHGAKLKKSKQSKYTVDTQRSRQISMKKKLDQTQLLNHKKKGVDSNIRTKQRILSSSDATINRFQTVNEAIGKNSNQRIKLMSSKNDKELEKKQLLNHKTKSIGSYILSKQRLLSSGDATIDKIQIIDKPRKRNASQQRNRSSGNKEKLLNKNQFPYYKKRSVGTNMRSKQKEIWRGDATFNEIQTVNKVRKRNTNNLTTSTIPKRVKSNKMICIEKLLKIEALRHLKRMKQHKGTTTNQRRRHISMKAEKELNEKQLLKYKKKAVGFNVRIKQKNQTCGDSKNKNANHLTAVINSLCQDSICFKELKKLKDARLKTPVNVCDCNKAMIDRIRKVRNEKLMKKQEALCDAKRKRQYKNAITYSRRKEIEKKKQMKLDKKQLREYKKYSDTLLLGESVLDAAKLGISAGKTVTKSVTTAFQDPECAYYNLRRAFRHPTHTLREIKSGISKSELFPTARRIKNRRVVK
ncbi:unnamed protein product [Diatraea saccharalis]|uniref:Uncharacterized protein n=1 Tax=Diatraea saccharalis TaxID=40085 RepID=A0A9N9WC74_9NEOP|nr:unnamed protein product [Diatraea saccharalis]